MYTITIGHFEGCNLEERKRCSFGSVKVRSPGVFVTRAMPTHSCKRSCGAENAMHCSMSGWLFTASSISKGEMVSPPRLMISFMRPVMNRNPSSSR